MGLLIAVETSYAVVQISGPSQPRAALLNHSFWPIPHIGVSPADEHAVFDVNFPLLFEETDYRVLAQSKVADVDIEIKHRSASLIEGLKRVPNVHPSTITGSLRFRRSVGLTTFSIKVGWETFNLTLEVFPSKLDYVSDYEAIVSDLRSWDRLLPLRYFGETYKSFDADSLDEGRDLDWLTILKSEVTELGRSLRYANAHPLLSLEQHERYLPAHRVRGSGGDARRAVAMGRGVGPWSSSTLGWPVRTRIPMQDSRDSLDCSEHRWLRANLAEVLEKLDLLLQGLLREEAERRRRFRSVPHDVVKRSELGLQIGELDSMKRDIAGLQSLPIVAEAARSTVPAGFSSIRLLRSPGYGEAYRMLLALRLGLSSIDGAVDVSIARLDELYEAWCFIEVVHQLEELTGIEFAVRDFLTDAPLGTRLMRGKKATASFDLSDGRRVVVRYNRTYLGLTGKHKPDIELEFVSEDQPSIIIVLDAKYRVDASEEHVVFFKVVAPPVEAIGSLHRYRDAIVVERSETELMRPVVRGAALYPLSFSEALEFKDSNLADALEKYGIGAIPFLPGNTGYFRDWLGDLLRLPHADLAWNGPPGPELPRG